VELPLQPKAELARHLAALIADRYHSAAK